LDPSPAEAATNTSGQLFDIAGRAGGRVRSPCKMPPVSPEAAAGSPWPARYRVSRQLRTSNGISAALASRFCGSSRMVTGAAVQPSAATAKSPRRPAGS